MNSKTEIETQLVALINDYVKLVRQSIKILKPIKKIRGEVSQDGDTIAYEFHGNGCLMVYKDKVVNFDYDLDNSTRDHMVFNYHFLIQYYRSVTAYPLLQETDIHRGIEILVSKGLLVITGFIPHYELIEYPLLLE